MFLRCAVVLAIALRPANNREIYIVRYSRVRRRERGETGKIAFDDLPRPRLTLHR